MSDVNPSIAAVTEEIRAREQELEALRAALAVLQSDRQPLVHITTGNSGQLAISNIFVHHPNGNEADAAAVALEFIQRGQRAQAAVDQALPARKKKSAHESRASTAHLLTHFDRKQARSIEDVATRAGVSTREIAIGVLKRHGYLKKKGDGYVRTAKVYTP